MPIVMPIIRSQDILWLELGYGLGDRFIRSIGNKHTSGKQYSKQVRSY